MTFGRLKLVAIVAPLAFLTILWTLLHTVLSELHHFPYVLIVFALTGIGIAVFALSIFGLVTSLEERILEQNRQLEQRNQELAALLAVGRAASSTIALDKMLDEAMAAIIEVTRADAAEVWLQTDGGLTLARHHGCEEAAFRERTRFRLGEGLPGLAAELGASVVVHDLPSDERFLREAVKSLGFHTYCALPLSHRDEIVGVLGVASLDPDTLRSEADLSLLDGIGTRMATAIQNSRLHERVLDGAVLEERMRIARELHDGLAQVLGYINVQTHAVSKLLASGRPADAQEELAAMEEAARQVYRDVREEILGLRIALPRQGLVPALGRYLDEYEPMAGTTLRLETDEQVGELTLPPPTEIQLLRIVQEALRNVRKHAHASSAVVRLAADADALTVEVADDGDGFDPLRSARTGWPRFGLQTMRERAEAIGGQFELDSQSGRGTRVTVRLPLRSETETEAYAGLAG